MARTPHEKKKGKGSRSRGKEENDHHHLSQHHKGFALGQGGGVGREA